MKHRTTTACGFVILVAMALAMVTTTRASTIFMSDETCTLCKTKFKAKLAGSGTQFGMRLDLKPLGAIEAPWPVAVCPKCHFVLFADKYKAAELAKLRLYVKTKEYQDWGKTRSSHFLMAKLLSELDRDDIDLAHVYLKASWQEESNKKYLEEDLALRAYPSRYIVT